MVPETTITRGNIEFRILKKIEGRHVIKDIRFEADGKPFHFFEKVKLHTLEAIHAYASECGFERIKIWGDYQLNEFKKENSHDASIYLRKIMTTVLLLILSVVTGVFLGKHFGKKRNWLKSTDIKCRFLITICLNEVFPQVYTSSGSSSLGIFVIAGVLLQMIPEALTKGFEHGHFHHHSEHNILPVALMVGLFIHAFIEGIPLANEQHEMSPYLWGIVFHNLPISFILGAFYLTERENLKFFILSFYSHCSLICIGFSNGNVIG